MSVEDLTDSLEDPKDNPEGEPEGQEPAPEATPEAAPAAPEVKPEAEPAPEAAPASVDLSKISAEDVLKVFEREDVRERLLSEDSPVRRIIQSEKDKEIARERRKTTEETRQRAEAERLRVAEEERRVLLEAKDYEGLGQLEEKRLHEQEELTKYSRIVGTTIERLIREHPDFAVLGEETIERIYHEVDAARGTVIDFTVRLAEARRQQDVAKASKEALSQVPTLVEAEVEAALAARGLTARTDKSTAGDAPSATVSGGGSPKPAPEDMTYEKASTLYGEGELSWEEFQPWDEAHKKEINK
ncbi:MAG TPA: hypothetical protein VJ086_03535 [Rubrobacteraceae bacterium]|nr:hypothetical protein [Rubrobacteraceae bacterium]